MSLIWYAMGLAVCIGTFAGYRSLALKYGIVDQPNNRSSHLVTTARGAGIVFIVVFLTWLVLDPWAYGWITLGAVLLIGVGFWDDLAGASHKARLLTQFLSGALLLIQTNMFPMYGWVALFLLVGIVSALNTFNFMDGINGISGMQAITCFATALWLNSHSFQFMDSEFVVSLALAVGAFLVFNFRRYALCFLGDSGSLVLAYAQLFIIGLMIARSGYWPWLLLLSVFGVDSALTILLRVKRGENIFQPHRTHLYQYLANEGRWDHRRVSLLYGLLQVLVNVVVIISFGTRSYLLPAFSLMIMMAGYFLGRYQILRRLHHPSNHGQ